MLENQMIIGTAMIIASVVFHVTALVYLVRILKRITRSGPVPLTGMQSVAFLSVSVLYIVSVHTVEAWGWAYVYRSLGEFAGIEQALYFSVVTATTLGYGDITLSDRWQLLSSFEAMGGLILFGVSVAFLFEIVRPFFDNPSRK